MYLVCAVLYRPITVVEVEGGWGNHVELEEQATAIKHLDEEQQELLHKLLV